MKLLSSFLAWCANTPENNLTVYQKPELRVGRPEPQLPDWRIGEIDENGNRFWMIDYNGTGHFIKYVEYEPQWIRDYGLSRYLWKCHPFSFLNSVGVLHVRDVIYPENPPPGFALPNHPAEQFPAILPKHNEVAVRDSTAHCRLTNRVRLHPLR
jgi:hypothetical protein